jgi:uncharacterized membrane protein YeaQ/YmgE (transglycosylase-associated protein family)
MMSDVIVFAMIGLLTGAAVRAWYPVRAPAKIAETMLLGMAGSVIGGLISWASWRTDDGQLHAAALLMSFVGGGIALLARVAVGFARRADVADARTS